MKWNDLLIDGNQIKKLIHCDPQWILLSMNGFSMVPQQVAYNNNSNNTLGIPSQNNNNSSSLPNIKSSAQQAANHSMADYLENARCSQQMASQPFAYLPMTVRSMAGSNSLVVQPGGGTIYLGNMHPQGSYMESLYGGSQVAPQVGSMPTQNGHFMLQHLPNQVSWFILTHVEMQNDLPLPSNVTFNFYLQFLRTAELLLCTQL